MTFCEELIYSHNLNEGVKLIKVKTQQGDRRTIEIFCKYVGEHHEVGLSTSTKRIDDHVFP